MPLLCAPALARALESALAAIETGSHAELPMECVNDYPVAPQQKTAPDFVRSGFPHLGG